MVHVTFRFACFKFDDSKWLKADVGIRCGTDEHTSARILAATAIGIYSVGLLLIIGGLLFSVRRDILSKRSTALSRACAFLYRDYKSHMYMWELVEGARRLVLVGFLVLYQGTMLQLSLGTVCAAAFMVFQVQAEPCIAAAMRI